MPLKFSAADVKTAQTLHRGKSEPHAIPRIADATKRKRERIWNEWLQFASMAGIDSDSHWEQLAIGTDEAIENSKAFLRLYATVSCRTVPVLTEEEEVTVRRIRCASTLEDIWSIVVKMADQTVMHRKRLANPREAHFWQLSFNSQHTGSSDRPGYRVARWIPDLAEELEISLNQLFVKRAATAEDTKLILSILWQEPEKIPCSPAHRICFHIAVLLMSLGGWRPASVTSIKFRHITIAWIRDKSTSNGWRTISNIEIGHVKKKKGRISRYQNDKLDFWISEVPFGLICLVKLLVSLAVHAGAFQSNFKTADEVLKWSPPADFQGDYLEAEWRPDFLDQKIVSIAYPQFWGLWSRVCTVAGLRDHDHIRPYSLRVGAGRRLDGALSPALRNFILSNSTGVFEKSYQAATVDEDLVRLAYGDVTNFSLAATRNAFMKRDMTAPVFLSKEQFDEIEGRRRVMELRASHKQYLPGSQEAKRILSQIHTEKVRVERVKLAANRAEYFREASRLSQNGESTAGLLTPQVDPRRRRYAHTYGMALSIGEMMTSMSSQPHLADALVNYLHHINSLNATKAPSVAQPEQRPRSASPVAMSKESPAPSKESPAQSRESLLHFNASPTKPTYLNPLACLLGKSFQPATLRNTYSSLSLRGQLCPDACKNTPEMVRKREVAIESRLQRGRQHQYQGQLTDYHRPPVQIPKSEKHLRLPQRSLTTNNRQSFKGERR
ncbi:hypothetical protein HJFPF1_13614 [Paramyrothecium foliicola]|nr:hypothetical protein HJFPF1_13614 [Paramyrothecium foliicola]